MMFPDYRMRRITPGRRARSRRRRRILPVAWLDSRWRPRVRIRASSGARLLDGRHNRNRCEMRDLALVQSASSLPLSRQKLAGPTKPLKLASLHVVFKFPLTLRSL